MSEEPPRKQPRLVDGKCRAFGGSENLPVVDQSDGYQLLDEVTANDNDDDGSASDFSDESGMSNEEIDALLEEGLPVQKSNSSASSEKQAVEGGASVQNEDYTLIQKTVIADSDDLYGPFDKLPEGWVMVSHCSGMHVYLHRVSRVCTMSRPYFIGRGSTRRHAVPLSAIPCLLYRRKKKERLERQAEEEKNKTCKELGKNGTTSVGEVADVQNVDSTSDTGRPTNEPPLGSENEIENSSSVGPEKDSLTTTESLNSNSSCMETSSAVNNEKSIAVRDHSDSAQTPGFASVEYSNSCNEPRSDGTYDSKDLNASKTTTVDSTGCPFKNTTEGSGDKERSSTFNTALAVALNIQPANPPPTADQLPGANRVTFEPLTLAVVEPEDLTSYCNNLFDFETITTKKFGNWFSRRNYDKRMRKMQPPLPEGTKLLSLKPNPSAEEEMAFKKKKWLLNPTNRSSICILHEYVQYVLKSQPCYKFKEVDNASCPYAAALFIDGLEYATGYGSSKKVAKAEAAAATLKILMPELGTKLQGGKDKPEDTDTTFFDQIRIEDPNVPELCNRMSELPPYSLLLVCLQRNYCLDGNNISCNLIPQKGQRNEFEMTIGKHTVRVPCKNKKEGKQKASQALLQKLHPHITSWGSMLRLYGNKSLQELKAKKKEEQEVTLLQNNATANQPNYSIINLLKKEMLKLHEERLAIQPIGTFIPPENIKLPAPSSTDLNTLDI
ncbi:Double-stranded RNA-binding domain [Trinorchestia longiramus]|nr:Double-stranded RNA-binding domain [Trinorchestia longiramus]